MKPHSRTGTGADLDPGHVVVSCVFQCVADYAEEAVLLYRSLELAGGPLADARRRSYCAGPLDPGIGRRLAALDVEVVEVEPLMPELPLTNKLHMFERRGDEELVVALDTDIVVTGDVWPWLQTEAVAAKPVDQNPFTSAQWRRLYSYFGLPAPAARHWTHFHRALTPPYFNSGVVFFPARRADEAASVWMRYIVELWDNLDRVDPELERHRYFTEQVSFALMVHDLGLPVVALPLELNFPTHHPIHAAFRPHDVNPLLVHHHHRFGPDGLTPAGYRRPDEVVADLNRRLSADELVPSSPSRSPADC